MGVSSSSNSSKPEAHLRVGINPCVQCVPPLLGAAPMSRFLSPLLLLLLCVSHVVAEEGQHLMKQVSEEPPLQVKEVPWESYIDEEHLMSNTTEWEIIPHPGLEQQFLNSSRRKLGNFQVCSLCKCCGGRRRFCFPTACCYTITCGSPNRPFGFCSFKPMSCNCFNCRL